MGQRKSKEDVSSYDVASVGSERNVNVARQSISILEVEPELMVYPAEKTAHRIQTTEPPAVPQNVDLSLVPEWVNEQHFVDLVRKEVAGFKQITNFKAYPALGFGENYSTLILRVAIDVELEDNTAQHKSFMLKVPHANEQMREMMKVANLFVSESEMYFDVIPELEKMYKEAGVDVRFGANAYKLDKDPNSFYVLLEDLGPQGFKNANRLSCLDKEHTESVLKKLAQLHAASASRVATKGPFSDIIMYGQFNEKTAAFFTKMFSSFQMTFLHHLKTYRDGEKYYDNMEKYFKTVQNQYMRNNRYDPSEFNVLNHGDCWMNNILFKNDVNGKVLETQFVDFQIPKFGSPAQDLQYFLMSSTQIGIKLKHFDYFIRYYHDHLIENLILLKYPKKLPTLRELHMKLFKYGPWSVTSAMMILPIVLFDSTEIASFKNFATNTEADAVFKNLMFTNKRYRAHIGEILPWLWNRGLLEPYEETSETQSALVAATETTAKVDRLNSIEEEAEKENAALAYLSPEVARLIPEWVNMKNFMELVQRHAKDFKRIKEFSVCPANDHGENLAYLHLAIDINVELKDSTIQRLSYGVTTPFPGEQAAAFEAMFNTFDKNFAMYNEFLPKFEQLFKDAGEEITFAPESHRLSTLAAHNVIVTENRCQLNYGYGPYQGFDVDHTKAALSKLAKFHAVSAYYCATVGDFPELLKKGLFSEETRDVMEHWAESLHSIFIDCLRQYNGNEEYIDKVIKGSENYFTLMSKACQVDEQSFNVLNQGDCWTKNIYFQHDSQGNIKDTCFVDYRLVKYGSPAQDLYNMLLSSPSLDIKLKHFDDFIKFYHDNLKQSLELLKYPKEIPNLEQLQKDLFKYGAWGKYAPLGVMSDTLLPPTFDSNYETMMIEDDDVIEFKKNKYLEPRYRQHVEALYPWLNRRELLDLE